MASKDESLKSQDLEETAKKRNAFAELMSPKSKQAKVLDTKSSTTAKRNNSNDPRDGLVLYILEPSKYPKQVIIQNENTVLIRDAFPKATVHLLLLPKDPSKRDLHPHQAFDDPIFLQMIKSEAADAVRLAASELSRLVGPFSQSSAARIASMESDDPPGTLPPGRDFTKELKVGIHAHPSMNHLHIHIISRDMQSDRTKHRKHYNSFNTEFFIPLDDYPLSKDDHRRNVSYQNANLKEDFKCWRCGKMFGNKFTPLKQHLEEEFEAWKRE